MASQGLVGHWIGMSEEAITVRWDMDQRARFKEIIANEQQRTVTKILDGIQDRAQAGDIGAVQWLEDRGLLEGDERRRIVQKIYAAIADRAANGDLDAVQWLEDRKLVALPPKV